MTIASELILLKNTKESIKNAIINKGVPVSSSDSFASYANKISQISSGTTINNQDKTIVANGTYTFDSGYTGLGIVTVNVPPTNTLNIKILGCDVNSNYIASNFRAYEEGSSFGGFTFNTGGKFLDSKIVHPHNQSIQISFKTPLTAPTSSFFLCDGGGGGSNFYINIGANLSSVSVYGRQYSSTTNYAFSTNTWYIIKATQKWVDNTWKVEVSLSTDNGESFTVLTIENGRLDSDSNGITYYMQDTQFGYHGSAQDVQFEIDLKKTGFRDYTNNFTYMFA